MSPSLPLPLTICVISNISFLIYEIGSYNMYPLNEMIHVEVLSTVMKVKMAASQILSFNNRKNSDDTGWNKWVRNDSSVIINLNKSLLMDIEIIFNFSPTLEHDNSSLNKLPYFKNNNFWVKKHTLKTYILPRRKTNANVKQSTH